MISTNSVEKQPSICGIHHPKLPVADVDRSGEWYARVLGFDTFIRFVEDGVLRGLGLRHPSGVQIAVRHDPERAAAMAGFDALALAVPTRAEVDRWAKHLDELGEAHAGMVSGHNGGLALIGLRDPDGIEVRLYSDETAPDQQVLAVDGGQIAYTDSGGDGDLVLLVHAGVFGAWFVPLAAEPALAGFRVVRMLRAGYTDGPPPDRHLSIRDHAAHCAALLDELDAGPATVVGHSSSSSIALQLAVDRPELVRGLVLGEPPLIEQLIDPRDGPAVRDSFAPVMQAVAATAAGGEVTAAYDAFMDLVCGPNHRQVVTDVLGHDGLARAVQESGYFFHDEIAGVGQWEFDATTAARVRVPVLLVQGGASPPPTHHLVARLAGQLPDASIATLDDDNHLLPLQNPAGLAQLVANHARAAPSAADANRSI
jgi:pimeloyl-ACP methyl ester carboxylesterase